MVIHYFQEDSAIFLAFNSFGFMLHTSNIISSIADDEKILEWLESVGKTETPRLLYRASCDGWTASDFYRMCDGKGATVTVVKSSDGYIFEGYTDVAWGYGDVDGDVDGNADLEEDSDGNVEEFKPSAESFFFSLKDQAGIGPVKMPIKSGKTGRAVYYNSIVGPAFGDGFDLFIASNAKANTVSSCVMVMKRMSFQAILIFPTS
jgi:hypothetical protein